MTTREHFRRVGKNPWAGGQLREPARAAGHHAATTQSVEIFAATMSVDYISWLLVQEARESVRDYATRRKDEAGREVVRIHLRSAMHRGGVAIRGEAHDVALVNWCGTRQLHLEWSAWIESTRSALALSGPSHASADKRASYFATASLADALLQSLAVLDWTSALDCLGSSIALVGTDPMLPLRGPDLSRHIDTISVLLEAPKPLPDEPVWWPEIDVAVERELVEMADDTVKVGYSALDDARRLASTTPFPRPDTWNMSTEGVLSLEWDRGENAGFVVVLSGALEASFSARSETFFSLMEDFKVDEGLPLHALQMLGEFLRG